MITAFTGNEIFCLAQKGFIPGNFAMGTSIYSLGMGKTIESNTKGILGEELKDFTKLFAVGRKKAFDRMMKDAVNVTGVSQVSCQMFIHPGNIEFYVSGSSVKQSNEKVTPFSVKGNGQELYLQLDAGYKPISFSFGNAAYSTDMIGGLIGKLKSFSSGEVEKYSDLFHQIRNFAHERIIQNARENKANAVVDIKMETLIFTGLNEILMTGTAVYHSKLTTTNEIATSHLSSQDLWNLTKMGYGPKKIILSSVVISVGFKNSFVSALKSFTKGESKVLTQLFSNARKKILQKMNEELETIKAEQIVGLKFYFYHLGNGLIEFVGIGTAIQKIPGIKTETEQLLPQAIIS